MQRRNLLTGILVATTGLLGTSKATASTHEPHTCKCLNPDHLERSKDVLIHMHIVTPAGRSRLLRSTHVLTNYPQSCRRCETRVQRHIQLILDSLEGNEPDEMVQDDQLMTARVMAEGLRVKLNNRRKLQLKSMK